MNVEGKPAYTQVPASDEGNRAIGDNDNGSQPENLNELQQPAEDFDIQHNLFRASNQDESVSPENSETSRTPNAFSSSSYSRRFEQPDVRSLAMYTVCCAAIYPFLYAVTLLCRGRSLFEVRLLVALGCTTVAFAMGFFLLKFAKRFIEATTWATLIQQNGSDVRDRMTLHELSELSSDPTSVFSAMRLLQVRRRLRRTNREKDSRHMWHYYLFFFSLLVGAAGTLSFVLGRIVNIVAETSFNHRTFEEVPIFGDLTERDMETYLDFEPVTNPTDGYEPPTLNGLSVNWTEILPPWKHGVQLYTTSVYGNDTVYFAEPYAAQLRADGFALGGFGASSKLELLAVSRTMQPVNEVTGSSTELIVLHYPQWGVRVACEKLPNPNENLIPDRRGTTIHLPRDFIAQLYSRLNVPFDEDSIRRSHPLNFFVSNDNITSQSNDANPSGVLTSLRIQPFDSVFSQNIGEGTAVTLGDPIFSDRSVATYVTDYGESGEGWSIFDVFLMRFSGEALPDFAQAPLAAMPVTLDDVGYDSVACVQRVEPWLIEVYNSTRVITNSKLLGKLANVDDLLTTARRRSGSTGGSMDSVVRSLTSKSKARALYYGYDRSLRSWLDRSGNVELASPLDVSFTDGIGAFNFTSIDAARVQEFRGVSGATVALPFLSGTQQIVARRYEGLQVAFAHILPVPMAIAIATLFLAGVIGCFCVPALPNGIPQRRFDLYSWVTAMEGDGLKIVTAGQDDSEDASLRQGRAESAPDWHAGMRLEHVEKAFGPLLVKYSVEAK